MNGPVPTGIQCPDCKEGEVMEKRSRGGKTFFSCGRYPHCRFATHRDPQAAYVYYYPEDLQIPRN